MIQFIGTFGLLIIGLVLMVGSIDEAAQGDRISRGYYVLGILLVLGAMALIATGVGV